MPKAPRLTARDAEALLSAHGFSLLGTSGSHRICAKAGLRIIVPFHARRTLHPKIMKQALKAIATSTKPTAG
jgi:predicted RNA binding protein YcfA (HicA-like mRNA interferase family)